MSSSAVLTSVRRLRCLMAGQHGQEQSDEQLLTAFAERRDDLAFAALMRRHGPMVLGVCRRVLGHEHDAEDAFQATFLVLARRAAMLRRKTALVSFLHSTACHLASKIKRAAGRRRKYEGSLGALTQPRSPANPADELSWREVRTCFDEEITRLPEIYRSVFVLCCLENVSRAEAARRLGVKEGTLSSRLAEARKRLARQLARRGVELTAVLAATALATPTASAVPAALMTSTMMAAVATAAGDGLSGVVSATVAELVHGATASMMLSKAKIVTVVLLAASMLAGASVWWKGELKSLSGGRQPPESGDAQGANAPRSVKRETTKTIEIQGRVLDPAGKPKAGAKILLLGKAQQVGTTGADGRFRIALPKATKDGFLVAQAEGFGIDFMDLPKGEPKKPLEFRLVKDRPIRGQVVNTEGKPVAGVRVTVNNVHVYANNSMDSFLAAWKKRPYNSEIPNGVKSLESDAGKLFAATTDAQGRFVFHGIGDERLLSLRLSGGGIADDQLWIVNRNGFDAKPYNQATLKNIPKDMQRYAYRVMLHEPDLPIVAVAEKPIHGIVKDAGTGKGRPGTLVQLRTRGNGGDLLSLQARADAQGRYEIHGARKAGRYMIEIDNDPSTGYMASLTRIADTPGYQPVAADITVKKGVIITGKVIDGGTGKSIPGYVQVAVLINNPFVKDYPEFADTTWYPWLSRTQADGTFRLVTIPGPVLLMGQPENDRWVQFKAPAPDPKYPQYFQKRIESFPTYFGVGGGMYLLQGDHCKVLEIKEDAKIVKQDIVLERASVLPVRLQDAGGKPLPGVWTAGSSPLFWYPPIQCKDADCSAYQVEPGKPRLLVFYEPAQKLAGSVTVNGDEKPPVTVKLGPTGSLKGRLLDADGNPLAGVEVAVHYRQRTASEIHKIIPHGKQIVTDANGVFAVDGLIPQQKFELSFGQGKRKFERTPKLVNPAIEIKVGEKRDLGALKVKRVAEKPGG